MTQRVPVTALVLALAFATLSASRSPQPPAATPPPPSQQPPSPPQPPGKPPSTQTPTGKPTFVVKIDLVTTDAIVRDSKGQFIADLTKDEFEVYEDGVKQDIISFNLVHGGRSYSLIAPPPPPQPEGIILPPARPTNDAAGRIFLLFVDDLHLDFRNTGRIRDLFKRIAKNLIHDGDMFGIVSTGPSSLAIDLTYDHKRLDEALKKIAGNGLKPSDIINGPEGSQGPSEVRYRAHVAFSTLMDILDKLEKVHNRRKAVIYVSEGYDFNPFPEARMGEDPVFGGRFGQTREEAQQDPSTDLMKQGQQFADADLQRELAEVVRTANRANATVYSIDPRGLVGGPDLDENLDPVEWGNYIRKSQDSLRVLADETGGLAVVNQNDFDRALKRIDAETSDYYMLGYYSTNPDPLRRRRAIEVKVKRPNVEVKSRKAYTLKALPTANSSKQ
jgi:VWFA-related protein